MDVQKYADILSGKSLASVNETLAVVKVIQAAEKLAAAGFSAEAEIVLGTLKDPGLEKMASFEEEVLFEVTE